jgi:hypothetical protein
VSRREWFRDGRLSRHARRSKKNKKSAKNIPRLSISTCLIRHVCKTWLQAVVARLEGDRDHIKALKL